MNRTLRLVLLKEIPEDASLRQQWNALVQRVDRPQVFYTYEWALAVQRAYGDTLLPRIFLAYDPEDVLSGVATLAADTTGSHASFLCATTADYCDFLSCAEHKTALVAGVLAELRKQGVQEVTLANLPADSNTVASLAQASGAAGYRSFMRTAYICAQVSLADLERRPGENKPVLPGKKMVRRSLSAMGREGPVRLDHARLWDEVRPILPEFIQAHIARFLVTGRISNMARPERRRFLAELAKLLCESGSLALSRMMSGAKVLAWNYGFQYEGAWFWYQPTFDSDLEKLSPGFCMLAKLVEEASENPALSTVDLGLGAEEYKERFANQSRETLHVTLSSSAAHHVRGIARYRLAQSIKKSPGLETTLRALTSRLQPWAKGMRRDGIVTTVRQQAKGSRAMLWAENEILFFEWNGTPGAPSSGAGLKALDLAQLAAATARYVDHGATLEYLLRSASRLREKNCEGFGLVTSDGSLRGCVWGTVSDGFVLPEVKVKVDALPEDSVILFDRWTPPDAQDHGYGVQLLRLAAGRMREAGKKPWTFCLASDVDTIENLEKSGFHLRRSLVLRRRFGWQSIKSKNLRSDESVAAEVSARVG